jgi:hypothetical protein
MNNVNEAEIRAESEYNSLLEAYATFRGYVGLGVPEPYGWHPSHGAVVMKVCEGPSLTRFLSRSTLFMTPAARQIASSEAVRRCAAWLKVFHGLKGNHALHASFSGEKTSALIARLCQLKEMGICPLFNEHIDRDLEFYGNLGESVWDGARLGMLHHDFGCHNIVVDGEGITVLDLGDSRPGCVLDDVMRFVVELEMLSVAPINGLAKRSYRNLIEIFISEYFRGVDLKDNEIIILDICKKMNCLRLILTMEEFRKTVSLNKFRKFYHGMMLRKLLKLLFERVGEAPVPSGGRMPR